MADEKDAARQEEEMREHEREARERDADERSPDSDTSDDPEGGAEPAPPGNIQAGGQSG
jgi:hypothetical protein